MRTISLVAAWLVVTACSGADPGKQGGSQDATVEEAAPLCFNGSCEDVPAGDTGRVPCTKNMDCVPLGLACISGTSLSNQQGKCVPMTGACDPQNTTSSPCFGLCYPVTAYDGFCSSFCTSTGDCPAGYFCYSETIEGQTFKTCQSS
jgi:hypothetical protein